MIDTAPLRDAFLRQHPAHAVRVYQTLDEEALTGVVAGLGTDALAELLDRSTPYRMRAVFRALGSAQRAAVLRQVPTRIVLTVLAALDPQERTAALTGVEPAVARELGRLSDYPPDSAARMMDISPQVFRQDFSVTEVLEALRGSPYRRLRSLYIVDDANRLVGRADMQAIALAERTTRLGALLEPVDEAVELGTRRDELVEVLGRTGLDSIPVVDADRRLLGVVRYEAMFLAVEAEASIDMQRMVGAGADERALSSPWFAVRKRLPWLHINLLTAFLAAAVVGLFEDLIAQFTALAILLPVVAGQSGNAGSQALAVTIRGLALREIGLREWRSVLGKETVAGLMNGAALAVTCGLGVWVWSGTLGLGLVIGVAMVLSMAAAGISGALVPIMLTRLGQDPATASSIILTTVTDVAGFFSFLGTATLLAFML